MFALVVRKSYLVDFQLFTKVGPGAVFVRKKGWKIGAAGLEPANRFSHYMWRDAAPSCRLFYHNQRLFPPRAKATIRSLKRFSESGQVKASPLCENGTNDNPNVEDPQRDDMEKAKKENFLLV